MIVSLIVAASLDNAIGKQGKLLWNLPNDTRFFKNTTWAMPVLMGRKTMEALGKPLNGRTNIVITSDTAWQLPGAVRAANLEDALEQARSLATREIFVIGGGQIYKAALPFANRVYLTRVHARFPDADAYFPDLEEGEWQLVFEKPMLKDARHSHDYTFQTWERKTKEMINIG